MKSGAFFLVTAAVAAGAASPAWAEQGDLIVRARAIVVAPNEKSTGVNPAFPTGRVGVDNAVMPEVDFTYMWTKHIGTELILATTKHDLRGRAGLSGVDKLGSAWALPPVLTVQYHFLPDAKFRPYVGAGANYTIFYSDKTSGALNAAIGQTSLHLKDSFGYALQGGMDIDITKKVFMNFDIKYVDMSTKARLNTAGAINRTRVDINPLIFGVGVGMRF